LAGIPGTDDAPGFPVMINQAGSYKLTGNLTVSADSHDPAICIWGDGVTLDLNGFSIIGNGNLYQAILIATLDPYNSVAIKNGTILGFGVGIHAVVSEGSGLVRVDNVRVRAYGYGVYALEEGVDFQIVDCQFVDLSGEGTGIEIKGNLTAMRNTIYAVGGIGIRSLSSAIGFIRDNTIIANLALDGNFGFTNNVFALSSGRSVCVLGGTNLGGNACNGSLMP
jgi:hypothetical protein